MDAIYTSWHPKVTFRLYEKKQTRFNVIILKSYLNELNTNQFTYVYLQQKQPIFLTY